MFHLRLKQFFEVTMRILAIGDVFGEKAVRGLRSLIAEVRNKYSLDLIVCNGENAADGKGLTPELAKLILDAGADVITTGNHIWDKDVIKPYLDSTDKVLRPANYPASAAGVGYTVVNVDGTKVLILNVSGTAYMNVSLACPFETAERIFNREAGRYDVALVDIHAEATGEKLAFARYFDGLPEHKTAAIWGTHTHIPTSDVRILPNGTGYVTDLGMTGPQNGVLGVRTEDIIKFNKDKMPCRFNVADGEPSLEGVIFEIDVTRARATAVRRVTAGKK